MTTSPSPEPGNRATPAGSGRTILVVEDNQDVSSVLAAALEEEGYTVRVVRNGQEVQRVARLEAPDLITLDLGLPGKSGWQVVADLRADPDTQGIPVVAISAHTRDLDPAFASSVARVIPKPFYLSQIIDAVAETLADG